MLLLVSCGKPDACELAVDRLARIAKKESHGKAWRQRKYALESCRSIGRADPVLRCALDETTDDATSECIGRVLAGVVKEKSGEHGSGLNPLLEK